MFKILEKCFYYKNIFLNKSSFLIGSLFIILFSYKFINLLNVCIEILIFLDIIDKVILFI